MQTLSNLIENPRFKALIDGFTEIINTCSAESLDAGRKRCTEFFLSQSTPIPLASIQNVQIAGSEGHQIPLRIYHSNPSLQLPVLVYSHRGGWVFGSIEEADPICRLLATHLQCVVVSIDYRLAPEHPFPKPLNDCYEATRWAYNHAAEWNGNPKQLIVCGESAGGNLAAAVALMAKEKQEFKIAMQLLIYPMITPTIRDASYDNCPDRHFITKEGITFMWGAYLQSPDHPEHRFASLDRARDLAGLPPTVIVTGACDPLCYEAEQYGHKLSDAGVIVRIKQFSGLIHGFLDQPIYDEEQKIAWIKEIRGLFF